MEITIKTWDGGKFDVLVSSKEGADPFMTIKSCKIMSSSKGDFVSYPSTKNEKTGKWWNHFYGSDKFNAAVLEKARAALKEPAKSKYAKNDSGFDDMQDDVPF